jgi:hypothetical protein
MCWTRGATIDAIVIAIGALRRRGCSLTLVDRGDGNMSRQR